MKNAKTGTLTPATKGDTGTDIEAPGKVEMNMDAGIATTDAGTKGASMGKAAPDAHITATGADGSVVVFPVMYAEMGRVPMKMAGMALGTDMPIFAGTSVGMTNKAGAFAATDWETLSPARGADLHFPREFATTDADMDVTIQETANDAVMLVAMDIAPNCPGKKAEIDLARCTDGISPKADAARPDMAVVMHVWTTEADRQSPPRRAWRKLGKEDALAWLFRPDTTAQAYADEDGAEIASAPSPYGRV